MERGREREREREIEREGREGREREGGEIEMQKWERNRDIPSPEVPFVECPPVWMCRPWPKA